MWSVEWVAARCWRRVMAEHPKIGIIMGSISDWPTRVVSAVNRQFDVVTSGDLIVFWCDIYLKSWKLIFGYREANPALLRLRC